MAELRIALSLMSDRELSDAYIKAWSEFELERSCEMDTAYDASSTLQLVVTEMDRRHL